MGTIAITPVESGAIARQEFGARQIERSSETSSTAAAAQARAAVESRFIMALQRPRDLDEVRVRMLRECKRPGFAEVAIYAKPIGGGRVQGPSIRFAEAALRCMTNVLVEVQTIYDDAEKRIIRVSVTDLESNLTYPTDKVIAKTVERRDPRQGQTVVGERINSTGQKVYIVAATEDDLLVKEAAIVSKTIRTNGLRLIPGDLIDEAIAAVRETLKAGAKAEDPATQRKAIVDTFITLGVGPSELKGYIGHELETLTADEVVDLRSICRSLKDGEATWAEIKDSKSAEKPPAPPTDEMAKLRGDLLARAAKVKLAKPERYEGALTSRGLTVMAGVERLDIGVLQEAVEAMEAAEPAASKARK